MAKIFTFPEALQDSKNCGSEKRHLLLGNGFSIACCPSIFTYSSLYEMADFGDDSELHSAFRALETHDFESVIRSLESSTKLAPLYFPDATQEREQMVVDAVRLKEVLVSTIAKNHPSSPSEIPNAKLSACCHFLQHFLGGSKPGHVFTVNYDLLLYWALMHGIAGEIEGVDFASNDGFGNDEDDQDAPYVVWQGESAARHQANVHFLHGALHLFDAGHNLQKFTWSRTDKKLTEQANQALEENRFPVFVAEGTSESKMRKIRHNAYLFQGKKHLASNADTVRASFFIHGHSLDENDSHILRSLEKGKFRRLYVSLFGSPDSKDNVAIKARASSLSESRPSSHPLEVFYYDAESARVWG